MYLFHSVKKQCRLTCMAAETGEIVQSEDDVIDGTFCSYENPHGICVQVIHLSDSSRSSAVD